MTTIDKTSEIERQPSPEDWAYQFMERLNGGLDTSDRPELVKDTKALSNINIRYDESRVLVDYGFTTFSQVVRGTPRLDFQFFLKNGSSILVLVTNATFYRWDTTAAEWQYVSDGTSTTLSTNEASGQTELSVTSESGFSASDHIGIALNDGTQHQTTIASTAAGTITVDDALPSAADSGKAVVKAIDFTGNDDKTPVVTTWAAFDKLYITNGVDSPKEFDGTEITTISNLPSSGNFVCAVLTVFEGYLHFFNTVEGGTAFPQRHRWSEPGSDSNFNENVNFEDLYDNEDFIVGAESIGTYLIIYRERSIYRTERLGLENKTWQTIKTIDAEGTYNHDCIINLGDEHLFFGNSNFYSYDGGFSIEPIGDELFSKIFAQDGELNPGFTQRTFGVYIEELDEAWWFYPAGSDEFCKNVIKLKIATRAWSTREYADQITGFGFFQAQNDLTWQNAPGTWAAYVGPWLSKQVQSNSPTVHLMSKTNLRVYEYDYITADDNGVAISYEFITKDFYIPNWELRFDRYDFKLKGTNILIEASYDQGDSWTTLGTVSPGNKYQRIRINRQQVGRSIRFRLSGSAGFGLEWIGVRYKAESVDYHG